MTAELTMDEVMLFDRHPDVLPLYAALREKLAAAYPRMTFKVSKTQVSFRERYVFAMASPPWRRVEVGRSGICWSPSGFHTAADIRAWPRAWRRIPGAGRTTSSSRARKSWTVS